MEKRLYYKKAIGGYTEEEDTDVPNEGAIIKKPISRQNSPRPGGPELSDHEEERSGGGEGSAETPA